MASNKIRLCIDRVIPDEMRPDRGMSYRALKEISAKDVVVGPPGTGGGEGAPVRMAIPVLKKWPNRTVLKCRFLDGSITQKKRVEDKAHIWEQYGSITFKFVESGAAEIRISFLADSGSWSALGTDALNATYFPLHQPTMNYGWLEDATEEEEYNRVVLHEFGHALAAIHEHQSPAANLKWNVDEVYRVFSGAPNFWSREDIEHNILNRYSRSHTNSTSFDSKSIMLYHFPDALFVGGKGTPQNMTLSALDKAFIKRMYPRSA
jgi:hypothetical protein